MPISAFAVALALAVATPAPSVPSAPLAPPAPPPAAWVGYWDGAIQIARGESEVDVLVELSLDDAGVLQGRLWFPTHPLGPSAVEGLAIRGRDVAFEVRDKDGIVSSFAGALRAGEPVIDGTFREQQATYPFELRRRPLPPPIAVGVAELADDAAELRAAFARDAGHVRLLLILSPRSFQSKITLRVLKRYVLDAIADPALRVYVVWEPPPGAAAQGQTAAAIKPLVSDPRVSELFSPTQAASRYLGATLPAGSADQYSVCLMFAGQRRWAHGAEAADRLWLAGKRDGGAAIAREQRFAGPRVAAAVQALLAAAPPSGEAVR